MKVHPLFLLSVMAFAGCKVTAEDIQWWKGTVKGPGKIVAVMLSSKYPIELRTNAGLALVDMDRHDVDGISELHRVIQRLDPATRTQLIDRMTPELAAKLAGPKSIAGSPPSGEASNEASSDQVRAKDAAYILIRYAGSSS